MKQLGAARRDERSGFSPQPFSGDGVICTADFDRVRLFEPAANQRANQVHPVVTDSLFADWRGNRLGYVSLLAIIRHNQQNGEKRHLRMNAVLSVQLTEILRGCYR